MTKYIFITSIPTPYRTPFYNELYQRGLNLEVFYMRKVENDRKWKLNLDHLKHPYYIDKGFYFMFDRFHFHFNPKLIYKIIRLKNCELILGAGWNDPDVLIIVLLKRLGLINLKLHFWTEANFLTIGARSDNFIKKYLRKFVYNSTKGAQLSSGKMTELTLKKWEIKVNYYIQLPNTINEEVFKINETELKIRNSNPLPVFILPIRLHEKIKGMINFFKAIGNSNIKRCLFLIAGDGPDRKDFEFYVTNNKLQDNIKILGHCEETQLLTYYKIANIFVLPSFTDASPLTLIEALKMKLPVLVSERCGNHFEAVIEHGNGYLFDPSNHDSIKKFFELILFRKDQWKQMGEVSYFQYEKYFNKNLVITNFLLNIQKEKPL